MRSCTHVHTCCHHKMALNGMILSEADMYTTHKDEVAKVDQLTLSCSHVTKFDSVKVEDTL